MYSYAQIDKDSGICFGVSHLSTKIEKDNLIPLDSSVDVIGKRWNGASWEEIEQEKSTDTTISEPTNTELQDLLLSIMEGMADLYEMDVEAV